MPKELAKFYPRGSKELLGPFHQFCTGDMMGWLEDHGVRTKIEEDNSSPYKAVQSVMGEISGAIIAITLVMTAVFVPIAFMSGPVGVFYRQFSITMSAFLSSSFRMCSDAS